jgi:phosphohistidine phosphatase SixA
VKPVDRFPVSGLSRRTACAALLLAPLAGRTAAPPTGEAAAWAALRAPAAVALMRHAEAPGIGDPAGWRLDDCSTQRNLSANGRAAARATGERLRAARIDVRRVLSSPWCRCRDTAELLGIGTVEVEPTFGNAFVMSERRGSLTEGGAALIRAWRGPGVLLVVTHGENIAALTGYSPASGEIVVVRAGPSGALQPVATLGVAAGR